MPVEISTLALRSAGDNYIIKYLRVKCKKELKVKMYNIKRGQTTVDYMEPLYTSLGKTSFKPFSSILI